MITRRKILTMVAGLASVLAFASTAWAQNLPQVTLETTMGTIVVEVDTKNAPVTAENFLQYVRDGFYNGVIFHRVMDGFMIQTGGFTADMAQKPTRAPIKLEISPQLKNDRGMLAMARTSNPNSASAQFFINVVNNDNLNAPKPDGHGYAVFGRVVSGMEVVDKIRAVRTSTVQGHGNVPITPILINKASITQQ